MDSCGQKEAEKAGVPRKRSEIDLLNEVEMKKCVHQKERAQVRSHLPAPPSTGPS